MNILFERAGRSCVSGEVDFRKRRRDIDKLDDIVTRLSTQKRGVRFNRGPISPRGCCGNSKRVFVVVLRIMRGITEKPNIIRENE
jgi:hypothetical protein